MLMLSEFAGAAEGLPEAVRVNPYNIDDVAAQIRAALTMSRESRAPACASCARACERRTFVGGSPASSGSFRFPTPAEHTAIPTPRPCDEPSPTSRTIDNRAAAALPARMTSRQLRQHSRMTAVMDNRGART